MANYANAKATIAANIYTNHTGQVTAEMVKTAADAIVDTLIAGGYLYAGVAKLTPTQTNPGSPDANVFYIATEPGTYTNFVGAGGSLVVAEGEVAIFKYNGTWSKEVTGAATAAQVTELGQKLIKLVGWGDSYVLIPNAGDTMYAVASKTIKQRTSAGGIRTIPFYAGAIYTYQNELYVWNGSDLVGAVDGVDLVKKRGAVALAENTDLDNVGYGIYSFSSEVSSTLVHAPRNSGGGYLIVEKTTPANDIYKKQTIIYASVKETYVRYNIDEWVRDDTKFFFKSIFPYTIYFAARTYLYIEETGNVTDGIYIKPTSETAAFNVYGKGGELIYTLNNWAAFASALSRSLTTSAKGVENCLQLFQHESVVFDISANQIKVKTNTTILESDVLLVRNVAGRCLYVRQELLNINDLNERFEEIEAKVENIEPSLPDYWRTYMVTKLAGINEKCVAIGTNGDNFVFITDIHYEGNAGNSPALIRSVLNGTPVRNIVIGGDLISSATSRADACAKIQALRDKFDFSEQVFPVRGNHDVNIDSDTDITAGDFYAIMDRPLENIINTEKKLYFYRDNAAQKIRYIFIDAYGGSASALDSTQEDWIKERVRELQSGWSVVFFAHPYWHVSTTSSVSVLAIGTYIKSVINDLIIGAGGASPISAKVIALIVGHVHRDMVEFVHTSEQDYWIIGTTCDKGGTNPFDPDHSARTFGTTHEQAFDVYNLDTQNADILISRIGEGGDRIIHNAAASVSIGNNISLTTSLSGTITWSSNDSGIVTITSGVATGVGQGTTFVWAEDENGNKEYWTIKVQ